MGVLSDVLGLKRPDLEAPDPQDLSTVAASESCIAEPVKATAIDREALNARALTLLESNRTAFAPSAPSVVMAPAAPIPQTGLDSASGPQAEVANQVKVWAALVARKDFAGYEKFYAPDFTPDGGLSGADWATRQKGRFAQAGNVPVGVQNLKVRLNGLDRATVEFTQDYNDDLHRETTRKMLDFVKVGTGWLISRENSAPVVKK